MKTYSTHHLVKGSDTNHHGTLFAGRGAEWFVEAGFVAASNMTRPENTVCLNIHGMVFTRPVPKGTIVRYESRVVYAGRSSMVVYVSVVRADDEQFLVDGFMTFVHVDGEGKAIPHGLVIEPTNEKEVAEMEKAKSLLQKR